MKLKEKTGIVSYGGYIPRFRIDIGDIAKAWNKDPEASKKGFGIFEKSVPAKDEDAITMAVQSAKYALQNSLENVEIGAIYTGSESHPYAVKSTSAIVGQAIGLSGSYTAADMEFACKAGTAGLQAILGMVSSGMIKQGLAVGSDTAQSRPSDALEFSAGAGAAAMIVGKGDSIIAEVLNTVSFTSDTPDFWRREHSKYPSHGGRFTAEPAYFKHVITSTKMVLEESGMKISDFDHVVFHMPNGNFPRKAAKEFGVTDKQLQAGFVVKHIGNTYSACSMLGLASVLDQAKQGEYILVCSYGSGSGSDSFVLKATQNITKYKNPYPLGVQIKNKKMVSYIDYINSVGKIEK